MPSYLCTCIVTYGKLPAAENEITETVSSAAVRTGQHFVTFRYVLYCRSRAWCCLGDKDKAVFDGVAPRGSSCPRPFPSVSWFLLDDKR